MPTEKRRGSPLGKPKYNRLTSEKRAILGTLISKGYSQAEIARDLGVHKSSISRELKRNTSKRGYKPKKADKKARYRAAFKVAQKRKLTEEMWRYAMEMLAKGWSFAMISGRAKRDGLPMVCSETLYREYYSRQKLIRAGKSDEVLPPLPKAHRKRHKRAKSYKGAGRGHIPNRVDIDKRPESVENRERGGHWEGDLINGKIGTGNLVTLVGRMSRFALFAYAESKESYVIMDVILRLLASIPKSLLKTLTFDNGKEFSLFKVIEETLGMRVYFAKPYHSWERGTNENRNGIIRKVLPKGRAFNNITAEEMSRIDYMLNDRPLKCLNWRTPREVFVSMIKRHMEEAAA